MWCMETNITAVGREDQVTVIDARRRALEADCDLVRIGGRCHAEVVLKLPLVAVVNEIDSRINAAVFHSREVRDVASPFGAIIANEIIALAQERFGAGNARRRIGAHQPHTNRRRGS